MGQQQILLIVIGILVVTIAVCAGMMAHTQGPGAADREAMIGDLRRLATRAQGYYRWPAVLGGGTGSFIGLKSGSQTRYGTYTIASVTAERVVFLGKGRVAGTNGAFACMSMTVFPDTMILTADN